MYTATIFLFLLYTQLASNNLLLACVHTPAIYKNLNFQNSVTCYINEA